jgi:hypothetical protein
LGLSRTTDLDAADDDASRSGLWTRGLLIRRNIADGDLALFLDNGAQPGRPWLRRVRFVNAANPPNPA